MAKVKYEESNIVAIAEAIREKTGGTNSYDTSEMPSGIDAVFEAGKQAGEGAVWDIIQNHGARTEYGNGFSNWVVNDYLRPKYKVIPTTANSRASTFYRINFQEYDSMNARIGKEHFDFSQCPRGTVNSQGWYYTFSGSRIDVIEDIGMNNAYCFANTFAYCSELHTIECIYPDENTLFISAFVDCKKLVNLTVNGVIGQNGFNVQWSTLLDKESHISIINALSTTTSGLTVTFSKTAVNKAFETASGANDGSTSSEWLTLVGTRSNWTIALA